MDRAIVVTELSNAEFTRELLDTAVFFMFAEGGAMGEPGGIFFVTDYGQAYHANYSFGDLEIETVEEAFPVFGQCKFGMFGLGSEVP